MTIPLDRLPAPAAVVDETFEQLRDAAIADLTARVPDYDPRATDPAVRLLEVGAYVRLLLGGRVNDAVRGVFLATATAADLDNVAAAVNVARLPGENDDALRSRAQLAWEALSAAGPTGAYRFHALSVPGVRDVRVTSPDPGEVLVGVLSHAANGAADQALLDAVSGALNASSVRPVTDDLTVSTVASAPYVVTAALTLDGAGPDVEIVRAAALAAVRDYVDAYAIGRTVYRSALIAACHVPGVAKVELTAPAADVAVTDAQFALVGDVTITVV